LRAKLTKSKTAISSISGSMSDHPSLSLVATLQRLPRHLCPDPQLLEPAARAFPIRITSHFLSLIRGPGDGLARQVVPDCRELDDPCADTDPLAEEAQSPTPLIVHRYPRRVIFLVSNACAVHCRFCMRKRRVATSAPVQSRDIETAINYIQSRSEINEVILSGGDPMLLADNDLVNILSAIRRIPHVRVLRIHSRVASAWPQRITPELARRLAAFHPLFINFHFNHPEEITPEAARACALLADAGIPLGSQTVLLRGINDCPEVLHGLMEALLCIRVKPYYLHQIDRVPGTAHFQVPIHRSLELMAGLRGRLSGMAIPHLMIDLPGGGGKMALLPESVIHKGPGYWLIRNFQGRLFRYPICSSDRRRGRSTDQ
jgi:lysine 2,3-aminomutase